MCGIVGYITTDMKRFEMARRGFFKYALMIDTLRGPDSTGVIMIDKKFTVKRFKTLSPGFKFATSKQFDEMVPNGWCGIGHNRSATVGEVILPNAHPFKFGKISLVHNGTLNKKGAAFDAYNKDLPVDSMQICNALSLVPPKEAKYVLEQIDGDFAIVWVDERDRSINMARNSARPLHLSFNSDKSLILFMSDGDHLEIITKSLRHSAAYTSIVYSVDTNKHIKWKTRGTLRPEVTPFLPFLQARSILTRAAERVEKSKPIAAQPIHSVPSTTLSTQMTKILKPITPVTSLIPSISDPKRARELWQERQNAVNDFAEKYKKPNPTNEEGKYRINVHIPKRFEVIRTTSNSMIEACMGFFGIGPSTLLRFTPETGYELPNGLFHIIGMVDIWSGVEWEAVVNFVSADLWNGSMNDDWLVRPIGLSRNRSVETCPSMMVDMLHTSWVSYEKANIKKVKVGIQPSEEDKKGLVIGVEGRLINKALLDDMLLNGCIDCGGQLLKGLVKNYTIVNEGRDIVCEQCSWRHKFEDHST